MPSKSTTTEQKSNGRTKKIALGAAAAIAATAAGVAVAKRRAGGSNGHEVWEVRAHDKGWQLREEGADRAARVFETKKEAVRAARELVPGKAPSELRIYTGDDRLLDKHTYEAEEA